MSSFFSSSVSKVRARSRNRSKGSKVGSKDLEGGHNSKVSKTSFTSSFSALTGLHSDATSTTESGAATGPRHQKHGFMWKKPFRRNAVHQGSWKKQWFMLQDSFLVWYPKRPRYRFDIHPAGCLPMGGCQIFQIGKVEGGFGFEVSHPAFDGATLVLKCQTSESALSWIDAMTDCQKATFENCQYGHATMLELQSHEHHTEDEVHEALEKARKNAEKAALIAEENLQIMEDHLDKVAEQEDELQNIVSQNKSLNIILEKDNKVVQKKEHRIERAHSNAEESKKELKGARRALEKLEAQVILQPVHKRVVLENDMRNLRDFIDLLVPREIHDLDWDEF
mmetsp:Transcript_10134/g.11706  ORF Transcript_10134/g.11706 Transcript_10134/m.11706 type:complete len:337 (+) Transcript_10134:427-1437(+)|eukprot:CAMPEP_0204837396 /NCGR_PEP_ID=MMETSP1346-20131115/27653_1 /ASSEMBLY_ACC=CAM_ASM_000771 /TAXON_ID=215587 /ORGANISM="Aplanochytrium stocchinoi, Strain GSBS06" /LENGTH=336 /DNA_ID=CAMNT_0051972783 /DNA_START=341 /DNA_END=1351 /DNA_ORIENTATION=+